jgi:hypothetical protein
VSELVFGRDLAPEGKGEPMAYIARRPSCGHIVVAQADRGRDALATFLEAGVAGLTVERVPAQLVRDEGICDCPKPEQQELPL